MAVGAGYAGGMLVSIEGGALLPVAEAMVISFGAGYLGGFIDTCFQQTIDSNHSILEKLMKVVYIMVLLISSR